MPVLKVEESLEGVGGGSWLAKVGHWEWAFECSLRPWFLLLPPLPGLSLRTAPDLACHRKLGQGDRVSLIETTQEKGIHAVGCHGLALTPLPCLSFLFLFPPFLKVKNTP